MSGVSFDPGFQSIIFDCDSTLSGIEGIDVLAGERLAQIRKLTDAAMDGALPLEAVYGQRLALIRPTRATVQALAHAYIEALVPDARETVAALRWLGKSIRVLSGGLLPPVEALAAELGLTGDAVAAVPLSFEEDGGYRSFDADSPLARSGGKPEVIRLWKLPRPVLLVGDGATDLEARPAVDAFAAYMGVVRRPAVAAGADVVLESPSLAPVLALAADAADRERLRASSWAGLLHRGELLLNFDRSDIG